MSAALGPGLDGVLAALLGDATTVAPVADLPGWRDRHRGAGAGFTRPIERALLGGFAADRPAYAFASGYREALTALVPATADRAVALAATEAGGAHPRAILCQLEPAPSGYTLTGDKAFVTLAAAADAAVIIAREGDDDGRPRLAAVCVPLDRAGVAIAPLPPAPFAPEVPHARISFAAVRVAADERLPGDGYADYLKPFRTIEDIHVAAGLVGWLIRVWRAAGFAADQLEELSALVPTLAQLAALEPRAPATHVALTGAQAALGRALERAEPSWSRAAPADATAWQRDRALLAVAGKARAARAARARERFGLA